MPLVSLPELVAAAQSGHLISFPTDTVPALAALPPYAYLIFALKQRSQDKPLILMAANSRDLEPYIVGSEQEWKIWGQIMAKYWPGQLTLVLPASEKVPASLNAATPSSIGVRVPDNPLARAILAQTGPLATTSVNLSGQPPLTSSEEIRKTFPQLWVLREEDPQTIPSHLPSTVAKWQGESWEILRQGAIFLEKVSK